MSERRDIRDECGQTAVEFALVLPLLIALLLAIIQLGIVFNQYITITDAARAGARKAIVVRIAGGTSEEARQAVYTAAGSLDKSKLEVTATNSSNWQQAGTDVVVKAKYPYSIDLLGWAVQSGYLTSTMTERLE